MAQLKPDKATTRGLRCTADIPGLGLVDGRTREAKLYGQAVADIASDLGGEDNLTRAELELARRAAGLAVLAAHAESKLLAGEDFNVSELLAVGNAQRRLLCSLGLERRAKDCTPSLQEAIAAVNARKEAAR